MNRYLITAAILSAAIWIGCGDEARTSTRADLEMAAKVVPARISETARPVQIYGTVHAAKEATLSSRAMGPVVRVHVGVGDRVRKGEILIEIEERMSAGQLAQAQGALTQARAALTVAQKNHDRFRALYERDACSELEYDMAKMQFEQAQGAVNQAEGAVAAASSVADESRLRAPFDAVVVQKFADVGDLAAPGRPLIQLQSQLGREFVMDVRGSVARHLEIGAPVSVQLDHRPDPGDVLASITELSASADPATHTYIVKAELESNDLTAGLTGKATITIPGERRVLIPEHAVYSTGGLHLVSVVDSLSIARTRAVTIGREENGLVEVYSGLGGSEHVVTHRSGPIAEGTRIKTTNS